MAAVHSRFARVFFGVRNQCSGGGLGGSLADGSAAPAIALQTEKKLNHRFEVWQGVLAAECQALLDEYMQNHKDGKKEEKGVSNVSACPHHTETSS